MGGHNLKNSFPATTFNCFCSSLTIWEDLILEKLLTIFVTLFFTDFEISVVSTIT